MMLPRKVQECVRGGMRPESGKGAAQLTTGIHVLSPAANVNYDLGTYYSMQ